MDIKWIQIFSNEPDDVHTAILFVAVVTTIIIVVTFPAGCNAITITTLKF